MATMERQDIPSPCAGCGKLLGMKWQIAQGKKFHPECFACGGCGQALGGRFFQHQGKNFCEPCLPKEKCQGCGLDIPSTVKCTIGPGGKQYHDGCFKCELCSIPLTADFCKLEGKVLCQKCFAARPQAAQAKPEAKILGTCAKCSQPITRKAKTYEGSKYHPECFACARCKEPLTNFCMHAEGFLCHRCMPKAECHACGKDSGIPGRMVTCFGRKYHEDCFKCAVCSGPLGDDIYDVGGDPSCKQCADADLVEKRKAGGSPRLSKVPGSPRMSKVQSDGRDGSPRGSNIPKPE